MRFFTKNIVLAICITAGLFSNSCTKKNNVNTVNNLSKVEKIEKENKTIATIVKKIEDGNINYEDIFEKEYNEYNEYNETNKEILNDLVAKCRHGIAKKQINVDKIIKNKIDDLVEKILNPLNMKYSLYGSDPEYERWFAKNENLKAPLNYFQQFFLSNASPKMLNNILCKMIKKITSGDRIYDSYYGSFWVVYNKKNKIEKSFKIFSDAIESIKNKHKKKNELTQKDINVLKTVLNMKEFNNIKTDGTDEYFAKLAFTLKSNKIIKKVEKIKLLK